ncbi:type II and III secretion system protein [endosymbiont of Ridgeia piscesae]|uniref:Type II and III secretion system protein n=1 Tax=endosymbiont of Ridgeia piscesae TaxID=54398 RepID=A0A0T5ZBA8_9GAMM|nr:type II and III secretion system protein [endosymbiont of Ridgeia piscesae]
MFDGLLLGVIPFIGEDGRVSLSIHPIKSEVDLESLKLVTIQNVAISLPKVNLEEISTTAKLHNGETVMLGGLISDMRRSTDSGFPGRDKLGVLGKIFGREDDLQETRELVVVLRVSVI